jgi:hypothetical protein
MKHCNRALLLILALVVTISLVGCGGEKLDFKLKSMEVRNIRNRDLAVSLAFTQTVRSISKEDGVKLQVLVYPSDDSEPLEVTKEPVQGYELEDMILLPGAGSYEPADYYKAWISLSAAQKNISSGYYVRNEASGVWEKVTGEIFNSTTAPKLNK